MQVANSVTSQARSTISSWILAVLVSQSLASDFSCEDHVLSSRNWCKKNCLAVDCLYCQSKLRQKLKEFGKRMKQNKVDENPPTTANRSDLLNLLEKTFFFFVFLRCSPNLNQQLLIIFKSVCQRLVCTLVGLRDLDQTQICTQVGANLSPFHHPTQFKLQGCTGLLAMGMSLSSVGKPI